VTADAPEPDSLEELEAKERSISAARRRLHEVIDFMKTLSPAAKSPQGEQLRHLESKEQEISKRRRTLQTLIDTLSGRNDRSTR
jgi:hypothetical protein